MESPSHSYTTTPHPTHQLEAIFTELLGQGKSAQNSEPHAPAQHLGHLLHIHHTKHKDELVEDKVPELVPHVLVLNVLELPKDEGVDELSEEEEEAAAHI
jgi:hypothetical protein